MVPASSIPRRRDPAVDQFAILGHDSNLAFLLVQIYPAHAGPAR